MGHAYWPVLKDYAEVDLYVIINNPQKVVTIPIECVTGKAVLIKPPDTNHIFVIKTTQLF